MPDKLSHKPLIHFCALKQLHTVVAGDAGPLQPIEQDDDMKLMKLTLPVVGALSLAACVDGGGGGASVTRAPTPAANCGYLQGLSAQHIDMIGSVRCGPQTELPYTFAN